MPAEQGQAVFPGCDAPHPVFARFQRYKGPGRPGYMPLDFLGSFVRQDYALFQRDRFLRGAPDCPRYLETSYPDLDEDIFAWIDLLEAVAGARGVFRMMELGAGFGCWIVRGALAAAQTGIETDLTAIEAEPEHYDWISRHVADNFILPTRVRCLHAALSNEPGKALFCVYSPWVEACSAGNWHGQMIAPPDDTVTGTDGTYHGLPQFTLKTGCKAIEVPVISLNDVLRDAGTIDFIHADLQDAEQRVFPPAIEALDRQVKLVSIGTHSAASEETLRSLFTAHGWQCGADYAAAGTHQTPFGMIYFQDGVQSWRNPRFSRY